MKKLQINLDLRIVCALLLAVIAGMLLIWKPWQDAKPSGRIVTVNGEASAKHAPDEYVFTPSISVEKAETNQAALGQVTKKGNEVVAKLKELGVTDEQLVTHVNSNGSESAAISRDLSYPVPAPSDGFSAYYSITCTIGNKELAQKITDYLAGADIGGGITPYAQFSDEMRKKIEQDLRAGAIEDAKKKAESEVKLIGAKLGKVVSVTDNSGYGGVIPLGAGVAELKAGDSSSSVPVLTGTQEVSFSVSVVFELK